MHIPSETWKLYVAAYFHTIIRELKQSALVLFFAKLKQSCMQLIRLFFVHTWLVLYAAILFISAITVWEVDSMCYRACNMNSW